ncbi:MAG TPA: hypothetical protein VLA17_17605 [Candidatus Limnocylindria bacterium]|nr:hypothetical protein [Candidatus Limnocylindria bacterium]
MITISAIRIRGTIVVITIVAVQMAADVTIQIVDLGMRVEDLAGTRVVENGRWRARVNTRRGVV